MGDWVENVNQRATASSVDAEHSGEICECSSCLVVVDEFVDFGLG